MKAALKDSAADRMHVATPAAGTQRLSWQAGCAQGLSSLVPYTCLSSACAGRHLGPW